MSSHRTSADNDSLFVAATFSTTPQHILQATGHRASTSSPNVRLQCHDSLTLFHISQLLSLSTNSNSSPPCLLTGCHCSLPPFKVIVTTTRQCSHHCCKSSTPSNTQLRHHRLCNIDTSSINSQRVTTTFNIASSSYTNILTVTVQLLPPTCWSSHHRL